MIDRLAKAVSVGEEESKGRASGCSNTDEEKQIVTAETKRPKVEGELGGGWCCKSRERK